MRTKEFTNGLIRYFPHWMGNSNFYKKKLEMGCMCWNQIEGSGHVESWVWPVDTSDELQKDSHGQCWERVQLDVSGSGSENFIANKVYWDLVKQTTPKVIPHSVESRKTLPPGQAVECTLGDNLNACSKR